MLLELVLFLLLLITMINTFFFWGLSVGYQHFKYTFNQGGNLPPVLIFSAWELFPPAQNGTAWLSQQIIWDVS